MVPDLLIKVLKVMVAGPATVRSIAENLQIKIGEAEALIGVLLAHGYLREASPLACASCPMARSCQARWPEGVRVYEITEKGRRLIEAQA